MILTGHLNKQSFYSNIPNTYNTGNCPAKKAEGSTALWKKIGQCHADENSILIIPVAHELVSGNWMKDRNFCGTAKPDFSQIEKYRNRDSHMGLIVIKDSKIYLFDVMNCKRSNKEEDKIDFLRIMARQASKSILPFLGLHRIRDNVKSDKSKTLLEVLKPRISEPTA